MKKLFLFMILIATASIAQENKYEKIKALKTAYITEKLNLTSDEAAKFWPVYNEYDEKFHQLRHKKRDEIYKKWDNGIEQLSEEEAEKVIQTYLELETEELNLEKQKTSALKQVLSSKAILSLRKAEDDFKRELLNRFKHRKDARHSPRKNKQK